MLVEIFTRYNTVFFILAESTKAGSGCEVAGITPGSEEHINLGLYGNRRDVFRMLQTECK